GLVGTGVEYGFRPQKSHAGQPVSRIRVGPARMADTWSCRVIRPGSDDITSIHYVTYDILPTASRGPVVSSSRAGIGTLRRIVFRGGDGGHKSCTFEGYVPRRGLCLPLSDPSQPQPGP